MAQWGTLEIGWAPALHPPHRVRSTVPPLLLRRAIPHRTQARNDPEAEEGQTRRNLFGIRHTQPRRGFLLEILRYTDSRPPASPLSVSPLGTGRSVLRSSLAPLNRGLAADVATRDAFVHAALPASNLFAMQCVVPTIGIRFALGGFVVLGRCDAQPLMRRDVDVLPPFIGPS